MGRHPIGPPLSFTVDRLLAPRLVGRGTVSITSGPFSVYGGVRYDPVRREVRFTPNAGELRAGLRYVFRVSASLAAWDGATLAAPIAVPFVPEGRENPPARPTPSLRRDIAPVLAARCGADGCHGGATPAMGLDLASVEGIVGTAVGVTAAQTANGRARPDYTDPRWGALLRIDPGDAPSQGRPEYSYLLYKALGDGPIRGARMPPEGPPLARDELERLSDWIAAGAPRD